MRFWRTALALSFAASWIPAQTTWVVDAAGGPGTHFTTIQAAVNAASAGDTILVRPATNGYAGATISKGVYLLGDGLVGLTSELRITGVPGGQSVSVKSFQMLGVVVATFTSTVLPIVCKDNAGTVHFEQVRGTGSALGPALTVEASPHVSATDCVLAAGESAALQFTPPADRRGRRGPVRPQQRALPHPMQHAGLDGVG